VDKKDILLTFETNNKLKTG